MPSSDAAHEAPLQGDFPYCYKNTANRADTPAVKHWRNRSRYLTRGGFWQLATALYQYNRGVLGNLVLLAIPIILIAIAVSYFYTSMRHYPYAVSLGLLVFLLINHLIDFLAYEERAPPKTRGWQELRNRYRALALGCLALSVMIESIPPVIEALRYVRPDGAMGISQTIGFLATAASASGVIRLLNPRSSFGWLCIRLCVGILSWSMIGVILVGLVDYLYFGIPPYGYFLFVPFIAGAVAVISGLRIGIKFLLRGVASGVGLATFTSVVLGFLIAWWFTASLIEDYSLQCRFSAQKVAEITRPLTRLDKALAQRLENQAVVSVHGDAALKPMPVAAQSQPESAGSSASSRPSQAGDRDEEIEALLGSLASQTRDLEREYIEGWEGDYATVFLGGYLPRCESHVVRWWLRPGPNSAVYDFQSRSGVVSEWGVLYPLRPNYHHHAVAYMHSYAALDRLSPLEKQALVRAVTRESMGQLSGWLAPPRGAEEADVKDTARRAALSAILVHAVVKRVLPKGANGSRQLDTQVCGPLMAADGSFNGDEADSIIDSIVGDELIRTAVADTAVPTGDDAQYAKLLHVQESPPPRRPEPVCDGIKQGETSAADAKPKPLSLKSVFQADTDDPGCDRELKYAVVIEALLACLGHLHDAGDDDGVAKVSGALASLPTDRYEDELFDTRGERLAEWKELLGMTPENLAMVAAGLEWRGNAAMSSAGSATESATFDPSAYLADAFRQSVSIALDRTSDIPTPFGQPVYLIDSSSQLKSQRRRAQLILFHRSVFPAESSRHTKHDSLVVLGELSKPGVPTSHRLRVNLLENEQIMDTIYVDNQRNPGAYLLPETSARLLFTRLVRDPETRNACGSAIRSIGVGRYGNLEHLGTMVEEVNNRTWWVKFELVLSVGLALLLFGLAFISPNMTSIHRFYRESLSSAFLMTADNDGVVVEDVDVRLSDLDCGSHESTAPYPLINAALNVDSNRREAVRERNALPFLFSPLYVGGASVASESSRYVKTMEFEARNPSFTAASAMTVSGAAAAPMMGRYTNWAFRLPMVLTNLRLAYWIRDPVATARSGTFDIDHVRAEERESIKKRRQQALALDQEPQDPGAIVGLAFSGGGIRSAALNFGVAQGLFRHGVWKYVDYLSTVSGGGYVGTSISVFMRRHAAMPTGQGGGNSPTPALAPAPSSERWAVRCPVAACLFWEILGFVHKGVAWAYVSDGGHFENLGVYALLQRQCSLIIAGDGEADPRGVLDGLSRLSMLAEIDLGVRISFNVGDLERIVQGGSNGSQHFAVAHIDYGGGKEGWLLYLRSSLTGDEDQTITGYKAGHEAFPHESTTDQFFTEEQFEAYRRLGEHIVNDSLGQIISGHCFRTHKELVALVAGFKHV